MADARGEKEVTVIIDKPANVGGLDPAANRPMQKRSSVTDLIRRLDTVAESETPEVSSNKRDRSESVSPAQRDAKVRDTQDDWNKFGVMLDAALLKLREQIQADFEGFRAAMKAEFSTLGQRLKRTEQQLEQKEKELAALTNRAQATESELGDAEGEAGGERAGVAAAVSRPDGSRPSPPDRRPASCLSAVKTSTSW